MGKTQQPSLTRRCIRLHAAFSEVALRCKRGASPRQQPANPRALREARRIDRLHNAFLQVRAQVASGAGISSGLRRLRTRALKRKRCRYAHKTLANLFARWRRNPQRETLVRHYCPNLRRKIAAQVVDAVVRRLRSNPTLTITAAWRAIVRGRRPLDRVCLRTVYGRVHAQLPPLWLAQRSRRIAIVRHRAALACELATLDAALRRSPK